MTLLVASLGDSTSCGQGVGLRVPADRCWPALLAAALPGAALLPLARPGARLADLERHQLPEAVAAVPHLATVLIGLNDVARAGFDPLGFARRLTRVVAALTATGATVLLSRVHDPARVLPLPSPVAAAVRRRAQQVNAAVEAAAGHAPAGAVLVLDPADEPGLADRRAFDVDRLHPNTCGHALLAGAAARRLARDGYAVRAPARPALPPAPGLLQETGWAARHGLPWLLTHLPQLVPAPRRR